MVRDDPAGHKLVIFVLMQRLGVDFGHIEEIMKFILFLAVGCFLQFSCQKANEKVNSFQSEGVITGIDARLCPCSLSCPCSCGTLIFHFIDTVYTANIPIDNSEIFNLTSKAHFPVYVSVN